MISHTHVIVHRIHYVLGPNICLCALGKVGSRCYQKHSTCQCENDGTCVYHTKYITQEENFECVCSGRFHGRRCEKNGTEIVISFPSKFEIPLSIHVHFIRAFGVLILHNHTTIFKRISVDQDTVTIFQDDRFHIVFIEVKRIYYFTALQPEFIWKAKLSYQLEPSNRCPFIMKLFDASFVDWHLIRHIKYYHLPCQKRKDLACFYDEIHMCICNHSLQQANCFTFNHTMVQNCQGKHNCENNGSCFSEPICPNPFICVCNECYYGSRCQFSTKNFVLSLDTILGHQIRPFISFAEQRLSIKVITAIAILMVIGGLTSTILSILTFQAKKIRESNCGYYLLVSSCNSVIVILIFVLKFFLLILSQMALITNHTYLVFNCKLMDFFLKIFVNTGDWLNAFVAIDRAIISAKDNNLNQHNNKRIIKCIIICIYIVTIVTHIQDPIYRGIIDDKEENRIWRILEFSPFLRVYNSVILFLHFFLPLIINIISALLIIFNVARHRSIVHRQQPYNQHLCQQFNKFKHILIRSFILVILSTPQLIISFMSCCMYSFRDPWLLASAYFLSFLPSMIIFIIFVLPSKVYRDELSNTIQLIQRRIRRH